MKQCRIHWLSRLIAPLLLVLSSSSIAHLPISDLASPSSSADHTTALATMLTRVTPAVVNLTVETHTTIHSDTSIPLPLSPATQQLALGSGVIINAKQGLIVTNAHVLKDQKLILVTLKNGEHYRGQLIAKSDGFDIAVIKIDAKHLTALPFGNSNQLQVGDTVVTIGSPFGLNQSVTAGVVSALNRNQPKIEGFQSFIQTDAPINPGNSGGALVNRQGQLIGINTAIMSLNDSNIGIGFAIPSNMVNAVVMQLLRYGKVQQGMLGVVAQDLTQSLIQALHLSVKPHQGVVVTEVVPGSPADRAGIKPLNLITAVDHQPIQSAQQLHNMMGMMRPGTRVQFTLIQHNKLTHRLAVLTNPKTFQPKNNIPPLLQGLQLQSYEALTTDGQLINGIRVKHVEDTSPALLANLNAGDIITAVNEHPVHQVTNLIAAARHQSQLLLTVMRQNRQILLIIHHP